MKRIQILNIDCIDYMCSVPDAAFDLAICDPPYGHGNNLIKKGNTRSNIASAGAVGRYDNSRPPGVEYFSELKRVSRNQIVFGANHFADKFNAASSGWVVWDKEATGNFSDCELAYTSFNVACKRFRFIWNGMHQGKFGGDMSKNVKRIHPSQKPVQLYSWLLENFALPGSKVLDTHLGSASSAIACHYFGCEFVGCEIDAQYCANAQRRVDEETRQKPMFGLTL